MRQIDGQPWISAYRACLRSTQPGNPTTAMQADANAELLAQLGVGIVDVVAFSAGAWS
jgi:hypothetical protein